MCLYIHQEFRGSVMNDPEALVRSISPLSLNILNNVEEGVVVIDSCGKIVFMNQAATVI